MTHWHLARGFRFAGVQSGLRSEPNRCNLALVVSEVPATVADTQPRTSCGSVTSRRVK